MLKNKHNKNPSQFRLELSNFLKKKQQNDRIEALRSTRISQLMNQYIQAQILKLNHIQPFLIQFKVQNLTLSLQNYLGKLNISQDALQTLIYIVNRHKIGCKLINIILHRVQPQSLDFLVDFGIISTVDEILESNSKLPQVVEGLQILTYLSKYKGDLIISGVLSKIIRIAKSGCKKVCRKAVTFLKSFSQHCVDASQSVINFFQYNLESIVDLIDSKEILSSQLDECFLNILSTKSFEIYFKLIKNRFIQRQLDQTLTAEYLPEQNKMSIKLKFDLIINFVSCILQSGEKQLQTYIKQNLSNIWLFLGEYIKNNVEDIESISKTLQILHYMIKQNLFLKAQDTLISDITNEIIQVIQNNIFSLSSNNFLLVFDVLDHILTILQSVNIKNKVKQLTDFQNKLNYLKRKSIKKYTNQNTDVDGDKINLHLNLPLW